MGWEQTHYGWRFHNNSRCRQPQCPTLAPPLLHRIQDPSVKDSLRSVNKCSSTSMFTISSLQQKIELNKNWCYIDCKKYTGNLSSEIFFMVVDLSMAMECMKTGKL